MLDITALVELDADQVKRLSQASQEKAAAFVDVRQALADRFAGQSRITLGALLDFVDGQITEYTAASDPNYWSKSARQAAAAPAPAEVQTEKAPTKGRAVKDQPQA